MHKQTNDQMLKKAIENALPEQEMFNEIEIKIGNANYTVNGCKNKAYRRVMEETKMFIDSCFEKYQLKKINKYA